MRFRFPALVLGLFPLLGLGGEKLRLGADQWMPFNGDPASEQPGYVIEIARRVFGPYGIGIDYRVVPWGDALQAAAKGTLDGVIGANRSEAAQLLVPTECVGEPRVALWVRKEAIDGWRYTDLRSLLKVRVGVVADYKYWDSFDDFIAKQTAMRLVRFNGDSPLRDGLAQLRAGDIDVLPETLPVFAWTAKAAGFAVADFSIAYLHQGEEVYLAFSPAHPRAKELARFWDDGVKALRKSGELGRILGRYGQQDWQQAK